MEESRKISEWVKIAKRRYAVSDDAHDETIFRHLIIARRRLWTGFYGLKLDADNEVPQDHKWAFDDTTMEASIVLASFPFTTITGQEGDAKKTDKLAEYIIGNRMNYG